MRNALLALSAVAALAACAMPSTVVRSKDTRPSLAVSGAPPGSALFVDGLDVGEANWYASQPFLLRVEPGTHDVDVRDAAGRVLFQQRVFVESETKTIEVH